MEGIKYTDIMGPNVLDKLKYCGKNVRVYDLQKFVTLNGQNWMTIV